MNVGGVELEPILDAVEPLGELAELYPETPAEAWEPYRELYPELFAADSRCLPTGCFLIRGSDDSGDAEAVLVVEMAVDPARLAEPDLVYDLDGDSTLCAATRRALLPELGPRDVLVACGHYPESGIGRLATEDGGVVWEEPR